MKLIFLATLSLFISLYATQALADDDIQNSVVKIFSTQRLPDVFRPWSKQAPTEVSGSGVVIAGHRILTNAHVVGFATEIYVQPYQSADKITAKVVAMSPGIDVAILQLEDEEYDTHPPLPIAAALPKSKDKVNVYGYPMGGVEMSVTEGIVSRIEYALLSHGVSGLRIQIDAALNPGNSGGPAISNGQIVGLVISKIMAADKIGYLIADQEILAFLADPTRGTHRDHPTLQGISTQAAQNPALRKSLGLDAQDTGVLVNAVTGLPDDYPIHPGDVITQIGPHAIDNEGNVRISDDLRLKFTYYIPRVARDGKCELTVFRNGSAVKVDAPLSIEPDWVVLISGYAYPRYFIYGPIVFTQVSTMFLQSLGGAFVGTLAEADSPLATRAGTRQAFPGEELVVIPCPMFPHRITKGYVQPTFAVVTHINDVPVKNLAHLVELLRDLKSEYVQIRCAQSPRDAGFQPRRDRGGHR